MRPRRRIIIEEHEVEGWLVYLQVYVVQPGIAPAPWFAWETVEHSIERCRDKDGVREHVLAIQGIDVRGEGSGT